MGEPIKDRVSRLRVRKGEIQGKIKSIYENLNVRNAEFKISGLKAQSTVITARIKKLRRKHD